MRPIVKTLWPLVLRSSGQEIRWEERRPEMNHFVSSAWDVKPSVN